MRSYMTVCTFCGSSRSNADLRACHDCGGPLGFRYDYAGVEWDSRFSRNMWRYWPLLPVFPSERLVTLDEGGTPLLRSRLLGGGRLWLKDETRNPTGSHKDRALALGINHALAIGARV